MMLVGLEIVSAGLSVLVNSLSSEILIIQTTEIKHDSSNKPTNCDHRSNATF